MAACLPLAATGTEKTPFTTIREVLRVFVTFICASCWLLAHYFLALNSWEYE
jgi:hypothetical protein